MDISVTELLDFLPATLLAGSPAARLRGFASLEDAVEGDLSFFSDPRYAPLLASTRATAVLVPADTTAFSGPAAFLAVADPSAAFERITERYGIQPEAFSPGIHGSAVVGQCVSTNLDKIKVAANAVIEDGVTIGDGSEIGAGCFVGRGATLGQDCRLWANSTLHHGCVLGDRVVLHSGSVIGADGFGYVFENGGHRKVRQSGIVQVDDDVEIGAGTTVDRARFGRTWIGEGTKIDNQVQIAHNAVIGRHCIIVSGTGMAGSSRLGDYVVLAAQVGVAGHVTIGSYCTIAARAGVTKNVPAGRSTYMGFPAVTAREERRRIVASRQLPDLLERVKKLEAGTAG